MGVVDLTYKELRELSAASREEYLREIEKSLAGEFTIKNLGSAAGQLPSFEQVNSSIEFKLIPSGEFVFGFTEKEEVAARAIAAPYPPNLTLSEMRPARKVAVGSFLISRTPLLFQDARRWIDVSKLSPLGAGHENPSAPAYVERECALACAKELGCRLPLEIEWEYACRANTRSLFVWGSRLPSESRLSEWLDFCLPQGKWRENAFGLQLLFAGEWCMDEWRPSHDDNDQAVLGVYVVKGGGSLFWPWQTPGEAFVWAMPAMRIQSTDTGGEGCAFRLVKALL